ncbi:hypothetical protein [Kluyvera ascorbata]|uniref:hypothetical protein n=1 Tax=Kluyvera ascorbata TaxID=51288 RepID=UPI0039F54781
MDKQTKIFSGPLIVRPDGYDKSGDFEELLYFGDHANGAITQFRNFCICIPTFGEVHLDLASQVDIGWSAFVLILSLCFGDADLLPVD